MSAAGEAAYFICNSAHFFFLYSQFGLFVFYYSYYELIRIIVIMVYVGTLNLGLHPLVQSWFCV